MTTTTVEVERTVTEEEQLHLCDDCQREVDPDGTEYRPRKAGGPSLHFCSECLDGFSEDYEDGETMALREWWEGSWEANGITRTTAERFDAVWTGLSWTAGLSALAFIGVGIATLIWTVPYLAWVALSAVCVFAVVSALAYIAATAKHVKSANSDVFDE